MTLIWLAACHSDQGYGPYGPGGTVPDAPQQEDPHTTPPPETTPPETSPPVETTLPVPCPLPIDTASVATCQSTGAAALVGGTSYSSIQAASGAAGVGGTIVVCPGTWPGGLTLANNQSLVAADPSPHATVIDGAGSTFGVRTGLSSSISGFTIQNAVSADVAGAGLDATDDIVAQCMMFVRCHGREGGAMYVNGNASVGDALFLENVTTEWGAALAVGGWEGEVLVEDSVFTNNSAPTERGAGIYTEAWALTVKRSTFIDNSSLRGSAIFFNGSFLSGDVDIEASTFDRNHTTVGSAVELTFPDGYSNGTGTVFAISGSTFTGNTSDGSAGALRFDSEDAAKTTISSTGFTQNSGPYGALALEGRSLNLTFSNTQIADNDGTDGAGGISTPGEGGPTVVSGTGLVVVRNDGALGGISLREKDQLSCTSCDFGTGADDNTPVDLTHDGVETDELAASFTQAP